MQDFDNDDLEFLAAQARAEHVADDLRDELERLKAVNADLLEALERIAENDQGPAGYIASDAIAKAKGEQQ